MTTWTDWIEQLPESATLAISSGAATRRLNGPDNKLKFKENMTVQDEMRGRCLCGSISFTLGSAPHATRACWCRDCQYLSSGNASLSLFFDSDALSVAGEPAAYIRKSDGGREIQTEFCSTCGTPLFARDLGDRAFVAVRLGSLDDRETGEPSSTIWTKSAPSWARIDVTRPRSAGQPPMSQSDQ
ncbi:GFA family protein [Sphingopyxis sp. JAI128]|uniref:GFA family protein n=1 Tax=Sphingopyxis sp. JAI128 TaxID=2723066 RepID=UPI0016146DEC|nr:GFA family protein [Sphingopyxis sp. JAI128]MBB6426916.1 hypothetical protein [Sphingopyxis sp. JAI128]